MQPGITWRESITPSGIIEVAISGRTPVTTSKTSASDNTQFCLNFLQSSQQLHPVGYPSEPPGVRPSHGKLGRQPPNPKESFRGSQAIHKPNIVGRLPD